MWCNVGVVERMVYCRVVYGWCVRKGSICACWCMVVVIGRIINNIWWCLVGVIERIVCGHGSAWLVF